MTYTILGYWGKNGEWTMKKSEAVAVEAFGVNFPFTRFTGRHPLEAFDSLPDVVPEGGITLDGDVRLGIDGS